MPAMELISCPRVSAMVSLGGLRRSWEPEAESPDDQEERSDSLR